MITEDKIKIAIEKGYTCDTKSGIVYGLTNNIINYKFTTGYKKLSIVHDSKTLEVLQHQFIYYAGHGVLPKRGYVIDHINQDITDNRLNNLRIIKKQQNHFNTKAKGVTYRSKYRLKWEAKIMVNYKHIMIGRFNTEGEAKEAYLKAKELYHII